MTRAELGRRGEALAAGWYQKQGYTLLAQNYHSRYGEIDIIAQKDGCLVFAEVKTRSASAPGRPAEAVDARKQSRIQRTAMCYLQATQWGECLMRFDVVELLYGEDGVFRIRCTENAFTG